MSEEERKLVENNIVFENTLVEITPELMKKAIIEQDKEIERLSNIINELEDYMIGKDIYKILLYKLRDLRDSDKE